MNRFDLGCALLLSVSFLSPSMAVAGDDASRNSVGLSSYSTTVAYGGLRSASLDLNGYALFATRALDHHLAVRGGWFEQNHGSGIKARGFDVQFLAGNNFDHNGLKFFGGVGYTQERWNWSDGNARLEAPQVTLGVGYNWSDVSVEWWGSVRSSNQYDKLAQTPAPAAATAGSLLISYRF